MSGETACVLCVFEMTPWCVIIPDIQVITNPGANKDARDALVGGLRVKISV
jgi:carbohydrate-selective porin OprB